MHMYNKIKKYYISYKYRSRQHISNNIVFKAHVRTSDKIIKCFYR